MNPKRACERFLGQVQVGPSQGFSQHGTSQETFRVDIVGFSARAGIESARGERRMLAKFIKDIKILFVVACIILPTLSGCAALTQGRYVPQDGKKSPFEPIRDRYEPPKDPIANY